MYSKSKLGESEKEKNLTILNIRANTGWGKVREGDLVTVDLDPGLD